MSPPVCVNAKENGGEAAPYYLQNAKMRSTEFTEGRLLDQILKVWQLTRPLNRHSCKHETSDGRRLLLVQS